MSTLLDLAGVALIDVAVRRWFGVTTLTAAAGLELLVAAALVEGAKLDVRGRARMVAGWLRRGPEKP